jgi:hypothetical protein
MAEWEGQLCRGNDYRFGDLRQYLVGRQPPWPGERVPLLGCDCGEWGCWPLVATVRSESGTVTWSEFPAAASSRP